MYAYVDKRLLAGGAAWFFAGFALLHPASMAFRSLVHPINMINPLAALEAFNPHHLPMATFFGMLVLVMGVLGVLYARLPRNERKHAAPLEGLLPICSYCKKIRDDDGKAHGDGDWLEIETYISSRTPADFTHGICPECFERVIRELKVKNGD